MKIQILFAAVAAVLSLGGMGCMSVAVEEDGVALGGREGMIMINPAGAALSNVKSLTEITYESVSSTKDSSSFTLGYGEDDRDKYQSTVLYLLASGRYYPTGTAPEGFFINGDVGIGSYAYDLTDENDVTFMYGISAGYKIMLGAFVLDLGAGWLKTDFEQDHQEFTPLLRVQGGMKF